jgi:hypothetical protein
MIRQVIVLATLILCLSASFEDAQFRDLDTWLDSDGDGLPDAGAQDATLRYERRFPTRSA